jgi:hypothetical protein
MAGKSSPGIFLFISEWAVDALLPALLLAETLYFISPLMILKI